MSREFEDALYAATETARTKGLALDQRAYFAAGARWAKAWIEEHAPDPRQPTLPFAATPPCMSLSVDPLTVTVLAGDTGACRIRIEGDERVCSGCGLRWATGEKSPECGR